MKTELNWNEYSEIAELLYAQYPDTDLVNITEKEVEEMVNRLPGFMQKGTPPPKDTIQAIIYSWINLSDIDDSGDSKWDAHA